MRIVFKDKIVKYVTAIIPKNTSLAVDELVDIVRLPSKRPFD